MGSLFAKILLWFLGTLALSFAGFVYTSYHIHSVRNDFFARTLTFQMQEAQRAWDRGGPKELRSYLERLDESFNAQHHLTDANGKDLLDGVDRSNLLIDARPLPPVPGTGRVSLARRSLDSRHWLVIMGRPRLDIWLFIPYYICILILIALLCFVLAFDIAAPLRRLRRTVERFGQGDLGARVPSGRRDEIGVLARSFNRMAEQTSTLLCAERRLLQDVSHEIRSPLTRLRLAVELAGRPDERETALIRARKEIVRLDELVGELLQLTRSEGDPSARNREQVDVAELLFDIGEDCATELTAGNRRLDLRAEEPSMLTADRELLRRAVENVLRNAIRFSPENTAVELSLHRREGSLAIVVRDFGPGVPEDALSSIFHPFYRVENDRSRDSGGVGLGLAIAQRAVHLHDGKLAARNAHPGLEVTIELPLTVPSERPQPN